MSELLPAHRAQPRRTAAPAALAVPATAVVVGALWVLVTLAVPGGVRVLVAIAGGVTWLLLCGAVFLATRGAGRLEQAEERVRRAEEEAQAAQARAGLADADLAHLVDQTMPAVLARLREGATAATVFSSMPRPEQDAHERIVRMLVEEVAIGERRRAAATAACANAAGRVQALTTSILGDLREIENHCPEDLLGDVLNVDHSTAQAGRLADSIAVLTGARSGRRWAKPIRMESILRGAMGRIGAYQRVRVHSTSGAAIAGYAAEDVMHALAELMDNATKFSAPSEEVHVYVEDLHNGAVITIEDGGLGMKPQALVRAEKAVALHEPLDLTSLSGTRLGLAVVGQLGRKHQLHVFFRPSSRGGIGVVMRIPNHLITQPRPEPLPEPAPRRAELVAAGASRAWPEESPSEPSESGALPKRPRGQTLAASNRQLLTPSPGPRQSRQSGDSGARFGAFQQSRTRKAAADSPEQPGADEE
ncbi:sensor histidine kinase [Amycolatopsis saalfeldensis]|uniref:histidine kinase n=1 Tax=Amycolatopsis saalfeldensis TaxID=394193 RepID=A0A1H8XMI8_9PSEU|nr:ATP-binding protein [Amycolatopsis saalfeldensis]SEP40538.1 Signal transduction histidine kinase [Amycolatopsis saalfeldensis]